MKFYFFAVGSKNFVVRKLMCGNRGKVSRFELVMGEMLKENF